MGPNHMVTVEALATVDVFNGLNLER
jgi:hypothetical protein